LDRSLWRTRVADALRDLAAIAGTLPVAVLLCIGLARALPFQEPTRLAIAFTLAIPIWVAAMLVTFLARSAGAAWAFCVGAALVLGICLIN
jgi:hypothetical protein